ncbi:MAG: 23S rRNA (guanosine(2251)-2'-O)-methyltransferase RlmB [Chloroflexi bacterium]|nr:23S rRNA (guanosine(2251)-2'-O)-methyltransferase RlmB [Chloroflexota bacterium]
MDVIYGRNAILEALRGRRRVRKVIFADNIKRGGPVAEIESTALAKGVQVQVLPRSNVDGMARGTNHQGVIAEAAPYPYAGLEDIVERARESRENPLILLLDTLQDPQNFGSLLRSCEAVGVHGVVLPEHRSVEVTPAVCHVSAGACEHMLIARVTNLARAIEDLKKLGVWVAGLEGLPGAQLHIEFDYTAPVAVVVGSEGYGLSRLTREKCDALIRIPMRGRINSLNAAVAGSVVLYEAWRQRYGA